MASLPNHYILISSKMDSLKRYARRHDIRSEDWQSEVFEDLVGQEHQEVRYVPSLDGAESEILLLGARLACKAALDSAHPDTIRVYSIHRKSEFARWQLQVRSISGRWQLARGDIRTVPMDPLPDTLASTKIEPASGTTPPNPKLERDLRNILDRWPQQRVLSLLSPPAATEDLLGQMRSTYQTSLHHLGLCSFVTTNPREQRILGTMKHDPPRERREEEVSVLHQRFGQLFLDQVHEHSWPTLESALAALFEIPPPLETSRWLVRLWLESANAGEHLERVASLVRWISIQAQPAVQQQWGTWLVGVLMRRAPASNDEDVLAQARSLPDLLTWLRERDHPPLISVSSMATESPAAEAPSLLLPPTPPIEESHALQSLSTVQEVALSWVLDSIEKTVGLLQMLAIASKEGLLGKTSSEENLVDLRKRFPDVNSVMSCVSKALSEPTRMSSALATLAQMARAATKDSELESDARLAFKHAEEAQRAGDWPRFRRCLDTLSEVAAAAPHPLLPYADTVCAILSSELPRVLAALTRAEVDAQGPPEDETPALPEATQPEQALDSAQAELTKQPTLSPETEEALLIREPNHIEMVEQACQTLLKNLRSLSQMGDYPADFSVAEYRDQVSQILNSAELIHDSKPSALMLFSQTIRARLAVVQECAQRLANSGEEHLRQLRAAAQKLAWHLHGERLAAETMEQYDLAELRPRLEQWDAELTTQEASLRRLFSSLSAFAPVLTRHPERLGQIPASEGIAEAGLAFVRTRLEELVVDLGRLPPEVPADSAPQSGGSSRTNSGGFRFVRASALVRFPFSRFYATNASSRDCRRVQREDAPAFLPLPGDSWDALEVTVLPRTADESTRATSAAHDLLRYFAREVMLGQPLSRCLLLIEDARLIHEATSDDVASPLFEQLIVGLTFCACDPDRTKRVGKRRLRFLLAAADGTELREKLGPCVEASARAPGVTRSCGELIRGGFSRPLVDSTAALASKNLAYARGFADALAMSVATLGRAPTESFRRELLYALGLSDGEIEEAEDYLESSDPSSTPGSLGRRGNRPNLPVLGGLATATDFLNALGARLWERGGGTQTERKINISLPKITQGRPLYVPPGGHHLEIPLLVSNSSNLAAGGVAVSLWHKGEGPVRGDSQESHVAWLSDKGLRDDSQAIVSVRVEVDPEAIDRFSELKLSSMVSWIGDPVWLTEGRPADPLRIAISQHSPMPAFHPVIGSNGKPMDLTDPGTLDFSSESVKSCFKQLRERLCHGEAVRSLIYGRRRRGKSSIVNSLAMVQEIRDQYIIWPEIGPDKWIGTRMASLDFAIKRLADGLHSALTKRGEDVPPFDLRGMGGQPNTAETMDRYLRWLGAACARVRSPTRVLLLIDEFQKWLTGLDLDNREALLNTFRHFNDGALGQVEVSFVLSGLPSLRKLVEPATDFANAVTRNEIGDLSNEEAEKYIKGRIEWDHLELDFRSRRRLVRLSGGNPYLLNCLGESLLELLQEKRRSWCTLTDIDDLAQAAGARDSRVMEYLSYMLHEDEDPTAPALPQLTVLRTVASLISTRDDFDGYVRVPEVETWLREHKVEFDAGQPAADLRELGQRGVLKTVDGDRYALRGEWLCRQLAALNLDQEPLLPVRGKPHADLVLGMYLIEKRLSGGGQADIFRAKNKERGGNDVVLKIYRPDTLDPAQRVRTEAGLIGRIHHPCVVRCLGGQMDERHGGVVVLEWINGHSLADLLHERPHAATPMLPGPGRKLEHQVPIFAKLADGLRACHEAGVIHKDLSPSNIMFEQALGVWEPKIIDFGLSSGEPSEDGLTGVQFTRGYAAPEKWRGFRRTPAADIYALGMIILVMLTGAEPTNQDWDIERDPDRLLGQLALGGVPRKLKELLQQMLARVPAERPSAAEVHSALGTVLVPENWNQLYEQAQQAYTDERAADVSALLHKALSAIPVGERRGQEYARLLEDAATLAIGDAEAQVDWCNLLFDHWLVLGSRSEPPVVPRFDRLLSAISIYGTRVRGEGEKAFTYLLHRLGELVPASGLLPLVNLLCEKPEVEGATAHCFYEILMSYALANPSLIGIGRVEAHALRLAEKVLPSGGLEVELWLQRVRRLGHTLSKPYEDLSRRLAKQRERSQKQQVLPPPCPKQEMQIGKDERAHLNMERIGVFLTRVLRRYPFIYQIRRVEKDGRLRVTRPTLLGVDNLSQHLPAGTSDPGNIIPLALDGSYTAEDVALRMNIVLSTDITPPMRDAALQLLRRDKELFEFR